MRRPWSGVFPRGRAAVRARRCYTEVEIAVAPAAVATGGVRMPKQGSAQLIQYVSEDTMTAIRSQMSDTPLPARVILAGALGVLGVIGVGLIAGPRLQLSETYPLKAAALFAAMVAIVV